MATRRPRNETRRVTVDLQFIGDGRVVNLPDGALFGGVSDPVLSREFGFQVHREVPDEEGVLNPVQGDAAYDGALQVNLWGTSDDYRELGRYLLALAALDTSADPNFHQHHDGLRSADGRTQLHLIVRRSQGGPSFVVV